MPFPLPVEIEEIDRDWLTRALRVRAPDVTVRDFEMAEVIRGTCTKIRLRLNMDDAGRRAGIPERVILKGGFEPHSREIRCSLVESLGYRDLMDGSGLNSPTCYFADYDATTGQGLVIIDDLDAIGATIGNPIRPRSHQALAQTLSMLAEFHAKSWNCPEYGPDHKLGWLPGPMFSDPALRGLLVPKVWNHYLAMPRGAAASVLFHDLNWVHDALDRMAILAGRVPNCVVHGDTHLGNTFERRDGGFGFFDVTVRRNPAIAEVCYHVALCMDMSERPRWEKELLKHYLEELKRHGVDDPPSFDDAFFQYRAFLMEGFSLVIINDPHYMPEPQITAYAARMSAALLDHDVVNLMRTIN
jgi:hypothetical protein